MVVAPGPNMPLRLWLEQHLGTVRSRLDPDDLRRSVGREAQLAYEGGGFDLLIDFLSGYGALDADRRHLVAEGVVELIANVDRPPAQRRSGAAERLAKLVLTSRRDGAHEANAQPTTSTSPEAVALADAVEAARHFFLLSRAAIERARFGGRERAADLALFETFRFARIAAEVSGSVGPNESQLLATILSWSPAGRLGDRDLSTEMLAGVSEVEQATRSLPVRSMVLKVVSSNVDVTRRLSDCALELMSTVMRLGGLVGDEADDVESRVPATVNDELEAELAMVRTAVFVIPRGRSMLGPDPELDALWRIYRVAVPWSSPDRRTV